MCLLFEMAQNCPENLKKTEVPQCKRLYSNLDISSQGSKDDELDNEVM